MENKTSVGNLTLNRRIEKYLMQKKSRVDMHDNTDFLNNYYNIYQNVEES